MNEQNNSVVSIGDWFVTLLILSIPVVGFIMLFVWGFGGSTKPSKANYCKLMLILGLISVIVAVILFISGASIFSTLWNNLNL